DGYFYAQFGRWFLKVGGGWVYHTDVDANNLSRAFYVGGMLDVETIQVNHPNWYMQITRTGAHSDNIILPGLVAPAVQSAGGLAMLAPGQLNAIRYQTRLIDFSQAVESEVQYTNQFWSRLTVTGGLQLVATLPVTVGTDLDDGPGKPPIRTLLY